jgi:hypothetical protein
MRNENKDPAIGCSWIVNGFEHACPADAGPVKGGQIGMFQEGFYRLCLCFILVMVNPDLEILLACFRCMDAERKDD